MMNGQWTSNASGWSTALDDPIPLPRVGQLLTLSDARAYILKMKKSEQNTKAWQAAIEALLLAADGRGPLMHARIGVMRGLNRDRERVFTDRKDTYWGNRKLKRDE
jgi:hypothetical protein